MEQQKIFREFYDKTLPPSIAAEFSVQVQTHIEIFKVEVNIIESLTPLAIAGRRRKLNLPSTNNVSQRSPTFYVSI